MSRALNIIEINIRKIRHSRESLANWLRLSRRANNNSPLAQIGCAVRFKGDSSARVRQHTPYAFLLFQRGWLETFSTSVWIDREEKSTRFFNRKWLKINSKRNFVTYQNCEMMEFRI